MKNITITKTITAFAAGLVSLVTTITPTQAVQSPYGQFVEHTTGLNFSMNFMELSFFGDFTGDGRSDVLTASTYGNSDGSYRWYVIASDPSATYGWRIQIFANSYGMASDNYYAADFNGDGKMDILQSSTRLNADGIIGNNDLAWNWLRSTGYNFANGGRIADSYGVAADKYYIADFNGDNKDDVVISSIRLNADGIAGNNDLAWNYLRSNGSTFDNGGRIAASLIWS